MRIKKLTFSNINNLKGGPHIVSFEEEPLVSAGIFAITGPTGSGKSTLLDVITLALFNKIPRHGRVSKKAIIDQGSVITHHAKMASAAVEYEVNGLKYTSTWSVEVARTGNLKDYEMTLMDASGAYIDINKSQVPDKNAEIIGLNYDQFVKSIILSQGEFAKFLKADKNERGEMLEKLTGTDIYRKISVSAYDKHKEVSQNLAQQEEVLSEVSLFSDEEVKMYQGKMVQSEELIKSLEVKIKMTTSLIQVKDQLRELNVRKQQVASAIERNQEQTSKASEDFSRLKEHDAVAKYSREISEDDQARKTIASGKSFIKSQEEIKAKAEQSLKLGLHEMGVFVNVAVGLDDFLPIKDAFEKKVVSIDFALQQLKEKGGELRTEIKGKLSELDLELSADPQKALEELESMLSELESVYKRAGIVSTEDEDQLRRSIKEKADQITILKEVLKLKENLSSIEKEIKDVGKEIQNYVQVNTSSAKLLKKNRELVDALKLQHSLLLKQREDAIKIASLEKHRQELEDGKPCPLCGSVNHPYARHFPEEQEENIAQRIVQKESEIRAREVELRAVEKDFHQSLSMRESAEKRLKALEQNHVEVSSRIKVEVEKLSEKGTDPLEELEALEKDMVAMERGFVALRKWKEGSELRKNYERLSSAISEYQKLHEQRKALYDGEDVTARGDELQERITSSQSQIQSADQFIKDRKISIDKAEKEIERIAVLLAGELSKRNLSSVQELSELLIDREKVADLRSAQEKLQREKIQLETEWKTIQKDIETLELRDTKEDLSLSFLKEGLQADEKKRDELNATIGEIRANLHQDDLKRKQVKERTAKIAKLRKEAEKWSLLNRVIGSAKGDKFANYAQGLTLKNLLAHTNRRLEDLSDRYLLNRPGDDGTLSIIDRYQGNIERAVTTLSGGEVFIISLALALSLSDMASKNIALESLFIDEGFGTLDQETLDIAMSTLEKLQSENRKMVGVISHVEALKERITTQIQLKKNAQGYSKIEIVS